MTEPQALASRALIRYSNPWPINDVRYVPSFEEALKDVGTLNHNALTRFHDKFYGVGTITFSAVGQFEPTAVEQALQKGLSGWKSAPKYARITEPYHAVAPRVFDIPTPDKANAVYLSRMPLKLQDTDADFPALYLANFMLGVSHTSRLWNRIRETEGLSYTVRSSLTASSFEPSGSWALYAIYAPENRDRLEKAMKEELARVVKEGFSKQEVESGITAVLKYESLSRAQDDNLALRWIHYLERNRTFAWSEQFEQKIAALNADAVNTALRKYLDPQAFSIAVAGDFRHKKTP
jgi:zinc protease